MQPLGANPTYISAALRNPLTVPRSFGRVPLQMITEDPARQTLTVKDRLLDPEVHMSARRIVGLFGAGFAAAMAGRFVWRGLFSKQSRGALAEAVEHVQPFAAQNDVKSNVNVFQNFSTHPLYRLAVLDPKQTPVLLAYLGTSVLGYLAGSLSQGALETWVRRQETMIRAELISRLPEVFKASLIKKQGIDLELRATADHRIRQLLQEYRVPAHLIDQMLSEEPVPESSEINRNYAYVPIHREQMTMRFGESALLENPFQVAAPPINRVNIEEPKRRHWIDGGIVALGAATGVVVNGLFKLMNAQAATGFNGEHSVTQTMISDDLSSWLLNTVKSKNQRNWLMFGGLLALSALARVGKNIIDGMRQIEVTRHNARTEYFYQLHNWVVQDPNFHQIAESLGLENEIGQLRTMVNQNASKMPNLDRYPDLLHVIDRRVKTTKENVSRRSAPIFFPMTPLVGLVEARG